MRAFFLTALLYGAMSPYWVLAQEAKQAVKQEAKPDKSEGKTDDKSEKRRKKNSKNDSNDNVKAAAEPLSYTFEIMGAANYSTNKGSLSKSGEGDNLFTDQVLKAQFLFGWLTGESFEPIIEFGVANRTQVIGDYKSSKSYTSWGIGSLFNVPNGRHKKNKDDRGPNRIGESTWVPYGGFLIGSGTGSAKDGISVENQLKESAIRTRLIFGLRYFIYSHIALNMWMRFSYENQNSEASAETKSGGNLSNLNLDFNLFSFSIFI